MAPPRLLTLTTDFGLQDIYVGVLKGTIVRINPEVKTVDLTHQIPPQNLQAARFCLLNAVPYFPKDTVHVAVVDPGVGSHRRAIAVQCSLGFLVGPDNGLFSGVLSKYPAIAAVELTNTHYWRTPHPSATFHGRDIFAPVGSHLASGVPMNDLGTAIATNSLVSLGLPDCIETETSIKGNIQYIDQFGNLVTTIPGELVRDRAWSVQLSTAASDCPSSIRIGSGQTYSDGEPGEAIALVGSHGWVELAVNCGSAQQGLNLTGSRSNLVEVAVVFEP